MIEFIVLVFGRGLAAAIESAAAGASAEDAVSAGIERIQTERAKAKFPQLDASHERAGA